MRHPVAMLACLLLASWTMQVFADPPAHAPAKGWRKKHDPEYVGYTGTKWQRDYDISSGRCNRQEIGAVLGAATGGLIGSRVGEENRTVATIIGAAIGALIGSKIGGALDDADRGCFGHALEMSPPGKRVSWDNPTTGVHYEMLPREGRKIDARTCRDFTLIATRGAHKSSEQGLACQARAGVWELVGK
jgi:surface antigen